VQELQKKKERRQNTTIRAAADPFWQRPKKEAATRTVELLEREYSNSLGKTIE
jgi:hypothetical protein